MQEVCVVHQAFWQGLLYARYYVEYQRENMQEVCVVGLRQRKSLEALSLLPRALCVHA